MAQIYAALHPGEDLDAVSVEPWTAKGVELAIEFHGSHQRPPHGVLSESHLNSLAIALFLAMAESFNEQIGFLVLDDVINSFDVEHRGRLAELLADGFSEWQLIVLTHDQQFFEHLSRRAPSWRRLEFTSWSHESGPRTTQYETTDILRNARERLERGDVHDAAARARRALEELLQEVCEALWAPLPFRRGQANDKREIGELFKGVAAYAEGAREAPVGVARAAPQESGGRCRRDAERRRPCQPRPSRQQRSESLAGAHCSAGRHVVVPGVQDACLAPWNPGCWTLQMRPERIPAGSPLTGHLGRAGAIVIGQQLGHYVVLTELGRGGMGDVYVARGHATRPASGAQASSPRRRRFRSIVSRCFDEKPEPRPPSIIPTSSTSTPWRKLTA